MILTIGMVSGTIASAVIGAIAGQTKAKQMEVAEYNKLVRQIFQKLDSIVKDGNISQSELSRVLPYTTEVLFIVEDNNHDGLLQFDDFKEIIHNIDLAKLFWSKIENL